MKHCDFQNQQRPTTTAKQVKTIQDDMLFLLLRASYTCFSRSNLSVIVHVSFSKSKKQLGNVLRNVRQHNMKGRDVFFSCAMWNFVDIDVSPREWLRGPLSAKNYKRQDACRASTLRGSEISSFQ